MFSRLFNMDAPFWRAMGAIGDLIWLNVLTIVFSVPVITAGAALTALYDTARRVNEGIDAGITRTFVASFRANLGQSTLEWGVVSVVGALIAGSWLVGGPSLLGILKAVVSILYLMVFPFVWALQARLANTVPNTLRNAVLVAFGRPLPALAVLLIELALGGLTIAVGTWWPQGLILLLLLGLPMVVFATTPLIERAIAPIVAQAAPQPHD
ncbi:YesL family protein [Propionimicrobium sp. PCR01-08-3]|uniref:YesL family protein n=1 Tax=Propionimicrobium sp. PCR01-08-3 TaxID=3052086 RepID=UPI00255CE9B0|nr:YesL family protein [Propionimicrobium sp. PCR01-08-3]WIY82082.1 YesL family protein [Propionimicrobium sp. PCR01-08-3]